ncbi:MAG: DNA ligase D [Candidatus Binataceae bacterium]
MALERYREKRAPEQTPEPFGVAQGESRRDAGVFVIQKHAARRLHYDFRLEMEGVLRSWAVPKGPSLNPADKRLAVMVEDHPLEYGGFEGVIPQGNYGAGAVIVWDRGEYRSIDPPGHVADHVRNGKVDIDLHGFKLHGAYTLVRTRGGPGRQADGKENWLLIKKRDEYANAEDILAKRPRSVLSGLTIEEMRDSAELGDAVISEIAKLNPPRLETAPGPKSFPLCLARLHDEPFDNEAWLFELKYDGVRALAIRDGKAVRLFGRSGDDISRRYSEVALSLSALPFEHFVLDGEIVILDETGRSNFHLIQRRISVADASTMSRLAVTMPATFFVFDLLSFAGYDLRALELEQRKTFLSRLIKSDAIIRYCDHVVERGRGFFEKVAAAGLEGIVAKRRDSKYSGRGSGDWLKIKCPHFERFIIGGWTDPAGSRAHFGALLLGQYDEHGDLRFIGRVGAGFDSAALSTIGKQLKAIAREKSPFRRHHAGEPVIPRTAHFCEPRLACEVRYSEWTDAGGLRHPSFQRMLDKAGPREISFEPAGLHEEKSAPLTAKPEPKSEPAENSPPANSGNGARNFSPTHTDKVFWPDEGYTKGDLIEYYRTIAPWMLPYLKDRPVVLTRYPDGIGGKSFFQKDAPKFAPSWIRRETIYARDAQRDIAYFVLESPEAIAYMANLGVIPIHIWSSRTPHLDRPDWLLFDIDPKKSTTQKAIKVAREVGAVLGEIGLRPYVKTSGQMGIHVVVGLAGDYTFDQAKMFAELVGRLVVKRIPGSATLARDVNARHGCAYIDYLQLGQGKTIAAPFAVRPVAGAPVSAPIEWKELRSRLDPRKFDMKTMPQRMSRIGHDPFLGALNDPQRLEPALHELEKALGGARA